MMTFRAWMAFILGASAIIDVTCSAIDYPRSKKLFWVDMIMLLGVAIDFTTVFGTGSLYTLGGSVGVIFAASCIVLGFNIHDSRGTEFTRTHIEMSNLRSRNQALRMRNRMLESMLEADQKHMKRMFSKHKLDK